MVPTNLNPTGGTGDLRKQVEKTTDSGQRPVAPPVEGNQEKRPFRDVLNRKLSDKEEKKAKPVVDSDEEGEETSLFDIASQTPVRKVAPMKDATSGGGGEDAGDGLLASGEQLPQETEEIEPLHEATTPVIATYASTLSNKRVPETISSPQVSTGDGDEVAEDVPTPVVAKAKVEEKPVVIGQPVISDRPLKAKEKTEADVAPTALPIGMKGVEEIKPKDKPLDIKPETVVAQVAVTTPIEAPVAAALSRVPEQAAKAREVLIKLATEMIERLQTITTPEKVDTTFTLQTPLFKGVEVTVTEYTTAQKQFHITFGGDIGVDARNLIAMTENQSALREALLAKGYTLQTITIEQKIPGLGSSGAGNVASEEKGARGEGRGDKDTATDKDSRK